MNDKTIINDNTQMTGKDIKFGGRDKNNNSIDIRSMQDVKESQPETMKKTYLRTIWASKIQDLILLEVDHAVHGKSYLLYRGFQRLSVPEEALEKEFDEITNKGVQRALVFAHSELLAAALQMGLDEENAKYAEDYLNAITFMPGE